MSSPASSDLKEFLRIDRRKSEPLYLQLVYSFIQAVQRGYLIPDAQIPGTRIVSQELKIHRKTVVKAFAELQALGWLESIPNVGSFVRLPNNKEKQKHYLKKNYITKDIDFKKSFLLNSPFNTSAAQLKFNDGQPDFRLIESKEFARHYRSAINRKLFQQNIAEEGARILPHFKVQLSNYLNLSRNLNISETEIAIAKNKELLLYILAQLLIQPGDLVLIAGTGHFYSNMVFQQAKAKIQPIPIDSQGIDVSYIRQNFKKGDIRCLHMNSIQHYPSAQAITRERKEAVAALAQEYDFIIIEEDNEFEFHGNHNKIYPIYSWNRESQHIYLGSFARFLIPSFQREFLVAPQELIQEIDKYLGFLDAKGDIATEQALSEMIKEGEIHRYLWRTNKVLASRKERFSQLLSHHFGAAIQFEVPTVGLAFWLQFHAPFPLNAWAKKLEEQQVFIPNICLYQDKDTCALRLGFGHFNEKEMEQAIATLSEVYKERVASMGL